MADTVVIGLRQVKAAVGLRNFHSKAAQIRKAIDHLERNFARPIHLVGVEMLFKKFCHFRAKLIPFSAIFPALVGKWEHQVGTEGAQKKIA